MNHPFFAKAKDKTKPAPEAQTTLVQAARQTSDCFPIPEAFQQCEYGLYARLRDAVPILDAALDKIVRLSGGFRLRCDHDRAQSLLDRFSEEVPCGSGCRSLQSFTDQYLNSLLTYGNAFGEILICPENGTLEGLLCADPEHVIVDYGSSPLEQRFFVRRSGKPIPLPHPERIVFTALNPPCGRLYGQSILRGLPALSGILLRIYECIGQNYDRAGNVRYAVTYKPSGDGADRSYAKERAAQIAQEWSAGMNASRYGELRDFVAVGDVDIRVIGAENQLFDTEVPVRQLLEQLTAKLSIPPFLLGLNWSSTERMSAQQADILTSELEYYRRLLTPVLQKIGETALRLSGYTDAVSVEWSHINLQDEVELAEARLKNAQAEELELKNLQTKQSTAAI